MTPGLKYGLARVGIFVVCALPAAYLLPDKFNLLIKLLMALIVSAVLSFVFLRNWRDEVADRMSTNTQRRMEQKQKLRSALAGDDEASADRETTP